MDINNRKNGFFIVFEGIDGCGKSTQSKLLNDKLSKEFGSDQLYLTSEPFIENEIGKLIRYILKKKSTNPFTDALLFTANRMIHIDEIYSHLSKNHIVICDRYLDSTLNYQSTDYFSENIQSLNLKRNKSNIFENWLLDNIFENWLLELNRFIIFPDIVIILDMDIENCLNNLKNTNKNLEKFENKTFLSELIKRYNRNSAFAKLDKIVEPIFSKRCKTKYFRINCNGKSIEEVQLMIIDSLF